MASGEPRSFSSVEEAIEAVGLGRVQFRAALLAYGVWIMDALEVALVPSLIPAMSFELDLTPAQSASLSAVVHVGLLTGCVLTSQYGDMFGRRKSILISYVGTISLTCATATASSYLSVLLFRFFFGVAMGSAMGPSLALVNEICPAQYRTAMNGFRGVLFAFGAMSGAVIQYADNPVNLSLLSWRTDLLCSMAVPACLAVLSYFFMHESPLFLAHNGRKEEALKVVQWLADCNGYSGEIVVREQSTAGNGAVVASVERSKDSHRTWLELVGTCFNRHYALNTCCLIFLGVVMDYMEFGCQYAQPWILKTVGHGMLPGNDQLALLNVVHAAANAAAGGFGLLASETQLLALSFGGIMAPCMIIFALVASHSVTAWWQSILYYVSFLLPKIGAGIQYMVVYKAASDMSPPVAAATRGGLVSGTARLGAMLGPVVFELVHSHWTSFYYINFALALTAAVLAATVPGAVVPFSSPEDEQATALLKP